MTTPDRNKLDLRISTSLLELSILHVELKKHNKMSAAVLIEGAAQLVERAKAITDTQNSTTERWQEWEDRKERDVET